MEFGDITIFILVVDLGKFKFVGCSYLGGGGRRALVAGSGDPLDKGVGNLFTEGVSHTGENPKP